MKITATRVQIEHFTWVDESPGHERTYHFNVTAMLAHVHAPGFVSRRGGVERATFTITEQIKRTFAQAIVLDPARLAALRDPGATPRLHEPLLAVQFAHGNTTFVDGNHRLARWIELGWSIGRMYLFPLGTWEPFLFDPGPAMSRRLADETKRSPETPHAAL